MAVKITQLTAPMTGRFNTDNDFVFVAGDCYVPDETPAGGARQPHDDLIAYARKRSASYSVTTGATEPGAYTAAKAAILADTGEIGPLVQRWIKA